MRDFVEDNDGYFYFGINRNMTRIDKDDIELVLSWNYNGVVGSTLNECNFTSIKESPAVTVFAKLRGFPVYGLPALSQVRSLIEEAYLPKDSKTQIPKDFYRLKCILKK